MTDITEILGELYECLDELDELRDAELPIPSEDLEESNAEFEDTLYMLSEARDEDEDLDEELSDAVRGLRDLIACYARYAMYSEALKRILKRIEELLDRFQR